MRAKENINPADVTVMRWGDGSAFQATPQIVRIQVKKYFPPEDILCYTIITFGLDKTPMFCVIEQQVFPKRPFISSSATSLIIKFGL
jgi:hypothetical protein